MKVYKTRTSVFRVDNHRIISKTVIEGVNVTPEDVDEDQEMLLKLSGGKKVFVMVIATAFHTMTPEAIDRLKGTITLSRHATAMVSTSLGVRIFVDTISTSLKNSPPFEMFANGVEARKWLLSLKKRIEQKSKKNAYKAAIGPKMSSRASKKTCEVHIDKNGILTKKIFAGAHIDLEIAQKTEKQAIKLVGDKKVLALIDRRANYTITKEAIEYLKANEKKYRIATALIAPKKWNVISPPQGLKKSPTKVFKDKATGLKWLMSIKKKTR